VKKPPVFTALEATLAGVVALVLVAAAVLGSNGKQGEPSRPRTEPSADAAPKRIAVAPIARRVERLRGLEFRRRLEVSFLTPARASASFRERSASEYSEKQQRIDEEVLKLLGLIAPSTDLRKVLRAVAGEEVLGFYDDRSKRLVVVSRQGDSKGLLEITLAHELTHALEDQHFGFRGESSLTDDELTAESALVEGTATALMSDYAQRYLKLTDLLDVLEGVSGTGAKLPKFVERSLLFPYLEGEKFVTTFREGGSWRALDKVFELRHPRSTEQVMHPEKYAVDERPARLSVSDVTRRLGGGWARLDSSSVGEFDLRLWFRQVGRVKGTAAAAGWGGGRLELWRRRTSGAPSCPAPCLARDMAVLRLAWDTPADRREGEDALRKVFERGLRGKRVAARDAGVWSSRGGAIGLTGQGRQTTVVLAPSPAVVLKLLG
jgi:hypothetical protein